jgi:hypothetical protein
MSDPVKTLISHLAMSLAADVESFFEEDNPGGAVQRRAKIQVRLTDAMLSLVGNLPLSTQPSTQPPPEFEHVRSWIAEFDENMLLADGYEAAIVGVGERCGQVPLVVYDADKCIEVLMTSSEMAYDEAYEFFTFNTLGAWAGEYSPLYVWRPPAPDEAVEFTETPK